MEFFFLGGGGVSFVNFLVEKNLTLYVKSNEVCYVF